MSDDIIKAQQAIPLSNRDLEDFLSMYGHQPIIRYDDLDGKTLEEVLGDQDYRIVFLSSDTRDIGHWVCLILHTCSNVVELFDSMGPLHVDESHAKINDRPENKKKNYLERIMMDYCSRTGAAMQWNTVQLQKRHSKVTTCGRHIIARLLSRKIPLCKHIEIFAGHKKYTPDQLVTMLYTLKNTRATT